MKLHYLITVAVLFSCCWAISSGLAQTTMNQPARIYTKIPWSIGFGMKGTVTNIVIIDGRIHFRLSGWFWFHQYPWGTTNSQPQVIKVDCENGMAAAVTPTDSFVAMSSDWRGGSVQNDKKRLLQILQKASKDDTVVEFSLLQPKMDFGMNGFTLRDAQVWRITDADLR